MYPCRCAGTLGSTDPLQLNSQLVAYCGFSTGEVGRREKGLAGVQTIRFHCHSADHLNMQLMHGTVAFWYGKTYHCQDPPGKV